ncbi:MAG TPA: hypothetical protein VM582_01665 [Candidatus Thermoplasmatota archaeon]|nr:hypothetical protein [Candidatus Thermoplasmatota archaeon]
MSDGLTLVPGDVLKIERRYLVDGVVQKQTDQGVFAGVQVVGSAEHIVLEKGKRRTVRLVPLHSVAEITLVKAMPRRQKVVAPVFDPSVG